MSGSSESWAYICYIITAGLGGLSLSLEFLKFGIKVHSSGLMRLSANQMSCVTLVVLFAVLISLLFILSIAYPLYQTQSLVWSIYLIGAFTVFLTVIQSRNNVYMYRDKEVSLVLCYFVPYYDFLTYVQLSLELKRRLVRFVSHEVRIPLNALSLALQLLWREVRNSDLSDDAIDAIAEAQAASDLSSNILNDLLDYDKLESGLLILSKTVVQAWEFLWDAGRPFHLQVCAHFIYPVLCLLCGSKLSLSLLGSMQGDRAGLS